MKIPTSPLQTPQDAQEYEEAMNGPSAFDGFSAREVDRANAASESLVKELGDTRDIDRGFDNLSKPAQEQAAKRWANPHLAASYMRQMPSSIREEFESYLASLSQRDRTAVRRRCGLS